MDPIKNYFSSHPYFQNFQNNRREIGFLALGALIFITLLVSVFFTNNARRSASTTSTPQANNQASGDIVVYGYWQGNNSFINAYATGSKKDYSLATLPTNIKKVVILNPDTLLYINNTDASDHGAEIATYTISTKKTQSLVSASPDFGIDDFVISSNGKYLSTWEVQFAQGASVLTGGKSRVYTVTLQNPSEKHLIYDEFANQPVHYPRAITNDGTTYMDTFLPNSFLGWAYGMSKSDFTGAQKQDISSLKNGTYSSQPKLSPNGLYLGFTGYDGSFGSGTVIQDSARVAINTSNTLEIYNTVTGERKALPNISNKNKYTFLSWDKDNNLFVLMATADKKGDGIYKYSLSDNKISLLMLTELGIRSTILLSPLSQDKTLFATIDRSSSLTTNLGETYSYLLTSPFTFTEPSSKETLTFSKNQFQYIAAVSENQLNLASLSEGNNEVSPGLPEKNKQLRISTFTIKPDLGPQRTTQQSNPITPPDTEVPPVSNPGGGGHITQAGPSDCQQPFCGDSTIVRCAGGLEAGCDDSPLYVYGPAGTHIQASIQTPIFNASPPSSGTFDITLGENGGMNIGRKVYDRIEYSYKRATTITPPFYGTIVSKENLSNTLNDYAQKLGLNTKETSDLVRKGDTIDAPFLFVSFFDQATSEKILPITFSPQPDIYTNIVFYFKKLDTLPFTFPLEPHFSDIKPRTGITAVEISEIVE